MRKRKWDALEAKGPGPRSPVVAGSGPSCATTATYEQEPAVGSGGTYLGLSQRRNEHGNLDAAMPRDSSAGGETEMHREGAEGGRDESRIARV